MEDKVCVPEKLSKDLLVQTQIWNQGGSSWETRDALRAEITLEGFLWDIILVKAV